MMDTWSIDYADGSANAYRFRGEGERGTFSYDPVTPERSSTGFYSGGPPREGPLDPAQVSALLRLVGALEAERSLHVEHRSKGTGAFTVSDASGRREFIVARGPRLAELDAFVASL